MMATVGKISADLLLQQCVLIVVPPLHWERGKAVANRLVGLEVIDVVFIAYHTHVPLFIHRVKAKLPLTREEQVEASISPLC